MQMEMKAQSKGYFNSVFPNQEATLMQYLLVQMKQDGIITYGDMEKCIRFHEIVRTHMDRREHKIDTNEYLACYVTNESFLKLGINKVAVSKCIKILTRLGYLHVVTVKAEKTKRYIYPMLCRLDGSDYLPNATFEEANNYLYPKKSEEE